MEKARERNKRKGKVKNCPKGIQDRGTLYHYVPIWQSIEAVLRDGEKPLQHSGSHQIDLQVVTTPTYKCWLLVTTPTYKCFYISTRLQTLLDWLFLQDVYTFLCAVSPIVEPGCKWLILKWLTSVFQLPIFHLYRLSTLGHCYLLACIESLIQ